MSSFSLLVFHCRSFSSLFLFFSFLFYLSSLLSYRRDLILIKALRYLLVLLLTKTHLKQKNKTQLALLFSYLLKRLKLLCDLLRSVFGDIEIPFEFLCFDSEIVKLFTFGLQIGELLAVL